MNHRTENQPARQYNVCLHGASLDVGNRGCRALAASLIKLITDFKPNARIYLLYGNRTNGIRTLELSDRTIEVNIINYRLSPKAKINEHLFWILFLAVIQRVVPVKFVRRKIIESNRWLRTLESANFVGEIRGGDSFSDIYGLRRFVIGMGPSLIAILMRKKLVLLPQTYGPFKSWLARLFARYIIMRAERLYSRDKDSIEVVGRLLGRKGKDKVVEFCPDVAFALESILPTEPSIRPPLASRGNAPLIGLNVSGLLYVGGYTRNNMFALKVDYKQFVHRLLEQLLEQTDAHILLIPHVVLEGSDLNELSICRRLLLSVDSRYSGRVHLVEQEYDQSQIKAIIGLCDFFVGARMHACIAALSQGIPTVGFAYSKKFRGVFQTIGAEQYVADMRHQDPERILNVVRDTFEHRKAIRLAIEPLIAKAKRQITDAFETMLN